MPPAPRQPDRSPAAFPATRWTLIGRAGSLNSVAQPIALAELVRAYAPALRAHLLQSLHNDEHRADDLLQGFLTDKVLEQRLLGYVDPSRGRFRTFLLTALDRYVIDIHRHESAGKRSPQTKILDIDEQRDTLAAQRVDAFNLAWAREVLGEVLATMHQQCDQLNRPDLWTVFDVRYLKPATENIDPEPHEAIAKRLNLTSPQQAANLLITAKRMFTRVFTAVVSRYANDQTELREELTELWRIFASAKVR